MYCGLRMPACTEVSDYQCVLLPRGLETVLGSRITSVCTLVQNYQSEQRSMITSVYCGLRLPLCTMVQDYQIVLWSKTACTVVSDYQRVLWSRIAIVYCSPGLPVCTLVQDYQTGLQAMITHPHCGPLPDVQLHFSVFLLHSYIRVLFHNL